MNVPAILWEHSMQRYLAARIAEVAYDEATYFPACDVAEAGGARIPDEIIDHIDALTAVRCAAGDALIKTPTNYAGNILFKLEYALWCSEGGCGLPDEWLEPVFADLRRMGARQSEGIATLRRICAGKSEGAAA